MTSPTLQIDVHLTAEDLRRELAADVRAGLTGRPKELPPRWFYDERGSQLFDDITRLDEYYPTRRETEILEREAASIASRTGATVALWGHSYGAGCAMGGAALTPNVHHLVLYAPSLGLAYPAGSIESRNCSRTERKKRSILPRPSG